MTFGHGLVLRTKLQPPRLRRWTLARPRLVARLDKAGDYRLTLLEAPTGYGKSTLLAGWLASSNQPYAWHNLGQSDADPFSFLLHLIYAFREHRPGLGEPALALLSHDWKEAVTPVERQNVAQQVLRLLINELVDQLDRDTFVIFDDFHLIEAYQEVRALAQTLVEAAPQQLHIILATRQRPHFEQLPRWQAQGEALYLGKDALAFQPDEICRLFADRYGYDLNRQQAERLAQETEGWIIGLQMIWQNLQASATLQLPARPLENLLEDLPRNLGGLLDGLFDYLAQEVLVRQDADDQRFLLASSCLRRMTGAACDQVLEMTPGQGEATLRRLSEAGLFIIVQGESTARTYRYHHLFGEFLYNRLQAQPERAARLHRRAATYYESQSQPEEALHHRIAAGDGPGAARLLVRETGRAWLETGQFERLEHYLAALPAGPEVYRAEPGLLLLQGDCFRLTSRFNEALQSYQRAGQVYSALDDKPGLARALRGRAQVYLDTVQPAAAEEWLEGALAVAQATGDAAMQATLLRDLAENKLNRGRPWEAEELHRQARELLGLPPATATSPDDVRILLRSGRLFEAIQALEQTVEETGDHEQPRRPGRSHREKLLLLALLNAITGQGELAVRRAEQGIKLARELHTPFTEAVALQRLGHALTVSGRPQEALAVYEQGLAIGDRLQVRRLRAEGLMGQCLLHGRGPEGDLAAARQAGLEGIEVARQAGDEWIEGFLRVSLAAALVEHGEETEAIGVAQTARALLENCGDRFGQLVARLWSALAAGNPEELAAVRQEARRYGFDFLFDRPTMFGPKSRPLLAMIKERLANAGAQTPVAGKSAGQLPASAILRIVALGSFRVWRPDGSEVRPRDWQRDKARLLFQLLLTRRDKNLSKEQILDSLWPNHDSASADAGFKVALNALVRALEPGRSSRTQSGYIQRSGSGSSLAYRLRLEPETGWLDAAEFETLIGQGAQAETRPEQGVEAALEFYERALKLYGGDFLPGCLYEDWAAPERERLLSLFLTTAERVAHLRAGRAEWESCLVACRLILSQDNCWEEAYRLMMLALWKSHNRAAALRTYERCAQALEQELGVTPLPQTTQLYRTILAD